MGRNFFWKTLIEHFSLYTRVLYHILPLFARTIHIYPTKKSISIPQFFVDSSQKIHKNPTNRLISRPLCEFCVNGFACLYEYFVQKGTSCMRCPRKRSIHIGKPYKFSSPPRSAIRSGWKNNISKNSGTSQRWGTRKSCCITRD